MIIVDNINIPLSLNKGKPDLIYISIDEIVECYGKEILPVEQIIGLKKNEIYKEFLGYVQHYTSTKEEMEFIWVSLEDSFEIIYDKIRHYRGFLLPYLSESDYRRKMALVDKQDTINFLKLNEF